MEKQCKQCGIIKDFNEFYSHPGTYDRKLPRCKECVKEGRRSEKERTMARIIDNNRIRDKDYVREHTRKFRLNNPEKYKAHSLVNNFLRNNPNYKSLTCGLCYKQGKIHFHHYDYTKPNSVIPCCPLCHKLRHKGIEYDSNIIITLPF